MALSMSLSILLCFLFAGVGKADVGIPGACGAVEGSTCSNVLLQRADRVSRVAIYAEGLIESRESLGLACDESSWPDKDHGLVCGECKVLVNRFNSFYKTCDGYCSKVGRQCVGAWEEQNENCVEAYRMSCNQTIASSDAICQCGDEIAEQTPEASDMCYGRLSGVSMQEGNGIGVPKVETQSVSKCKDTCSGNPNCKSFTFCPKWNGCWMKDKVIEGGEHTKVEVDCKTYFKMPCNDDSPIPPTVGVPAPPQLSTSKGMKLRIASYNLYWWNAFDQNSWKGVKVTNNIKDSLKADVLGLQECDEPDHIQRETRYDPVSPFKGAQGIVVKPGLFKVGDSGSRDIRATGKWGPSSSGRTCNAQTRYEGAKNMLKLIKEKAGNEPVVITGDFNAGMGEPGPQHFMKNGFKMAISKWVDAIFYSAGHWKVTWSGAGDAAYSDHRPVVAELELASER